MSDTRKSKRRGRAGRAIGRWIKRLVLLAVVAAAGLFGLRAYIRSSAGAGDSGQTYARARVARGAMAETVYGTGTTSARNQPNLLAEADGTLTELRVSVGDEVRSGDILAVLTNEDIDDTITDLEFDLWELDETITGTAAGSKVTTVLAPAAGRVMAVYAGAGDDALAVFRREGALAIISTDGRMKAELASNEHAFDLTLDETVRVVGEGIDETGTVVDLTQQGTRATITVLNDDLPMGASVTIKKESGEIVGETTLEVNKPMAVSSFGGTIKSVRAVVGEKINRRETMFTLEDPPLTLTLENLRLQRETAAKELAAAKAQRESLIIVAPCDGTVATLEVQEGDEITSGTLIGSILQGEDMNLTIAVDELDVVSVAAGQPVTITVDALSDLELDGEVLKIAPVGSNSGGVTTYNVELTFEAAGTGVRSGMNATGEIQIAAKDDTLYVPVEALMTVNNQTFVMLADGGTTAVEAFAQAGGRGARRSGTAASTEGVPEQGMTPPSGELPQPGEGMPNQGTGERTAPDGQMADAQQTAAAEKTGVLDRARAVLTGTKDALVTWLYGDTMTDASQQVTGTLVKVEVGMQNDDYAELLSGVSEGDVVLYTSSSSGSSGMTFGSGNRGGSMGGMGGPMGF